VSLARRVADLEQHALEKGLPIDLASCFGEAQRTAGELRGKLTRF
jgi:hypothetical protein